MLRRQMAKSKTFMDMDTIQTTIPIAYNRAVDPNDPAVKDPATFDVDMHVTTNMSHWRLCLVGFHQGRHADRGHYFAYARKNSRLDDGKNSPWVCMDDAQNRTLGLIIIIIIIGLIKPIIIKLV